MTIHSAPIDAETQTRIFDQAFERIEERLQLQLQRENLGSGLSTSIVSNRPSITRLEMNFSIQGRNQEEVCRWIDQAMKELES